jgi:hypothetical protein
MKPLRETPLHSAEFAAAPKRRETTGRVVAGAFAAAAVAV